MEERRKTGLPKAARLEIHLGKGLRWGRRSNWEQEDRGNLEKPKAGHFIIKMIIPQESKRQIHGIRWELQKTPATSAGLLGIPRVESLGRKGVKGFCEEVPTW